MHSGIGYDQCLSFINCQISPAKPMKGKRAASNQFRALTLSRQSGSGAHTVAKQLADRLESQASPGQRPWTVFDRDLVTRVLEDHHFPARMAEFIPEDRRSELQDAVEEFFGLRPSSWTLIQHTSETILRLVELGNVILIGRAANLVTRKRPDVLHVRLVGSEDARASRLSEARKLSHKVALATLRAEDRGRVRYVKKYFDADIDDPQLYHLTLNTDLLSLDRVAELLTELMLTGPGEPRS
jgi:cytidylate kinase